MVINFELMWQLYKNALQFSLKAVVTVSTIIISHFSPQCLAGIRRVVLLPNCLFLSAHNSYNSGSL